MPSLFDLSRDRTPRLGTSPRWSGTLASWLSFLIRNFASARCLRKAEFTGWILFQDVQCQQQCMHVCSEAGSARVIAYEVHSPKCRLT
jgi:hypothetical protein